MKTFVALLEMGLIFSGIYMIYRGSYEHDVYLLAGGAILWGLMIYKNK